jgi:hypothetical protein
MKNKRLAALLLAGMLFFAQSISANAQVPFNVYQGTEGVTDISLQWTNVNDITLDLYFEDGEAGCSGEIRALSGTTKISATFTLERKSGTTWILEKSWSRSSNTNSLSFFGTDAVMAGFTYRLSVTANVTRNGVTETVSTSVQGKY